MSEAMFKATSYGETNQGMVRTNNEDTFICQPIWDDHHILCAAIDGLGGYEGGEVAAEIARVLIVKHLEEYSMQKTGDLLKEALIAANNEIIRQHESRPKVSQMGCVASVGLIDLEQGSITIAHVGDSRIYQYANGELKKLTHDHSLVGYREEIGEMSEEDAMHHPKRNVIDRFLGEMPLSSDTPNYVEISVWPILADTQYLFCSDGLTDLITSAQIKGVLSAPFSLEDKVQRLIALANEAGGKDNVTVVLADVSFVNSDPQAEPEPDDKSADIPALPEPGRCRSRFLPGLILGLVVGAAAMFGYDFYTAAGQREALLGAQDSITARGDSIIRTLNDSIIKLNALMAVPEEPSTTTSL